MPPGHRWYDEDPIIVKALEELRQATHSAQAQIALNIIKVVLEHTLEDEADLEADNLEDSVARVMAEQEALYQENQRLQRNRRWYDASQTLHSAMQLLQDCPEDLQRKLFPSIAQMIEATLAHTLGDADGDDTVS